MTLFAHGPTCYGCLCQFVLRCGDASFMQVLKEDAASCKKRVESILVIGGSAVEDAIAIGLDPAC